MQAPSSTPDPTLLTSQYRFNRSDEALLRPFVFEPIAYWALNSPESIAVQTDEISWTYAELEARTNRLARFLISRGVKRGDRVAFVLPRGPYTLLVLIAILKAGAAYVPIDSESPPARIMECLEDAAPKLLIASESSLTHITAGISSIVAENCFTDKPEFEDSGLPFEQVGWSTTDIAYIIFTSGSTGRPKGVPISHRSLSNFVWGDQEACIQVEQTDRVFQGFSPASDGHHEEVWPTFLAGATLVVGSSKIVHSGPDLQDYLNRHSVSIISCAPTLLSMIDGDVPSLRKILFGAESLPTPIVERWWKPDRKIINTYGPTEATVGATFGYCEPGKPINIGKALPNYDCYVLDKNMKPVTAGEEGQLGIAGVGVSQGYFGRDDLTATRFVPNPYAEPENQNPIIYLTGDRVRQDENGNLIWLGRIDAQIKIRGHRVELTEIESQVLTFPGVKSTAVVSRIVGSHEPHLVALVVLEDGAEFSIAPFLRHMRNALPSYMVPQVVEQVERLPVLPSGKIDRRACQSLRGQPFRIDREIIPPRTPTERIVLDAWRKLFSNSEISCADDFFTDLGGYSLLASRFISILRDEQGLTSAAVSDLYENPTVKSFAAHLDEHPSAAHDLPDFKSVPASRYRMAKLLQGIAVLWLFGIQGFLWLGPIILAIHFSDQGFNEVSSVAIGLAIRAAMVPCVLALVPLLKWTIVGKFKEGRYPVWGGVFLRWWFFNRLMAIAPIGFLTGTPLASLYMRLLGAKVGKNVLFESMDVDCPDLVSIGDNCSFENSSWLHAAEVNQGELHMYRIKIEEGCLIGVRSGVSGGATIEEGATLRDLTSVSLGVRIPAYEEWCGSPARRADRQRIPKYDPSSQPTKRQWAIVGTVQFLCMLALTILESVPFVVVGYTLYSASEGFIAYLWEPFYAIVLVLFAGVQALIFKWAVLGRMKPGTYRFPGAFFVRKWITDRHLELMSAELVPIYDSLFARGWCVALGMKCGPRCEIALPRRMPYDLVEMGEGSFLASEVSIGMPIRRNGKLFLEQTVVGDKVFLGNDAVVPQGAHVPQDSLLGVLSVWPDPQDSGDAHGQAWLGSPAFRMPNREIHSAFDIRQTYFPTRKMMLHRLGHEAFRLVLPSLCLLILAAVFIEMFVAVWNESSLLVASLASPLIYLLIAVLAAVICKICKAILVGKYVPTVSPLWSPFVWRAETYSAVLHDFGVPTFIQALVGTPFLAWLMRFLGAKVGSRSFINTTDWTETDLIKIGCDVAINTNAPLQAHLFEDRVMKVGAIKIGDRCSVGHYSVILCDSELRDDAHVGHVSLVMKGETIPSNTFWAGSPVQASVDPVRLRERLASLSRPE